MISDICYVLCQYRLLLVRNYHYELCILQFWLATRLCHQMMAPTYTIEVRKTQAAQTSIQATVSLDLTTRYAFIRASADGSEFRDYDLLEQVMPTIPTHTHSRDTASLPHFAFAEIACCVLVRIYLRDCIISSKMLHTSDGHVCPFV